MINFDEFVFLPFEDQPRTYLPRKERIALACYNFPGAYTREEFAAVSRVVGGFLGYYESVVPQPHPFKCNVLKLKILRCSNNLCEHRLSWGIGQWRYPELFKELAQNLRDYEKSLRAEGFNDIIEDALIRLSSIELPWQFLLDEAQAFKVYGDGPANHSLPREVLTHFEKIALEREKWENLCIQPPDDGLLVARIHALVRQFDLAEKLNTALKRRLKDAMREHTCFYAKPYKIPPFGVLFDEIYKGVEELPERTPH